jgi:hypothetical protein
MFFQTLERRRKIIEQNHHRNPQTWDTIRRIINRLDADGMSGDETETPLGANPKKVRRVALPWISVGNASLPRLMEAKRTSQNSIAIARLPRNWYDGNWYKVNSSSAKAHLGVRKDFEIPFLVRSCIFEPQTFAHYVTGCILFCERRPSMKTENRVFAPWGIEQLTCLICSQMYTLLLTLA